MKKTQKISAVLILAGLAALGPLSSDKSSSASTAASPYKLLLSGAGIIESSPATADFDGDGRKEIVVGGSDGMLYVVSYNGSSGTVVWSRQTNIEIEAANPPTHTSDNIIRSSPAIADLDNDGHLEIVIAVGGDVHDSTLSKHRNGGILVYKYNSAWSFSPVSGWPQPKIDQVGWPPPGFSDPDGYWDGIATTPALGDIDGDGKLEIVVEGIDRRIHAWHYDGTPVAGWPIYGYNGDNLLRGGLSSPALGDLDGDGLVDVVVGTMSPPWDGVSNPDYNKGTLWAIKGDSTNVPGFPVATEQYIHSSPALADLNNDRQLEIVSSVGWGTSGRQNIVYAWNHDGTLIPNWPQQTAGVMMAPPALGDIDGDGKLEIVAGCGNSYDAFSCSSNTLYAWRADGTPVFTAQPPAYISGYSSMPYSPVLADIDGDGAIEILVVHFADWGVTVIESNGSRGTQTHQLTDGYLMAPPVVDDVDNDGKLEIVAGGTSYSDGKGAIWIWDENGSASPPPPWPMFHHDVRRTGRYMLPPKLGFPSEIRILHQQGPGNSESQYAWVRNDGEGQFNWRITNNVPSNKLQVIPSSGVVTTTTPAQFIVTTTSLSNGWNTLGTVQITGTVSGQNVLDSPITSTVYVYIGDVSHVYLPVVLRNY